MQHGFNIVNAVLGLKGESQEREIMPLLELERSYILEVLNATNGQIKGTKGAAALLGVPPSTLYNKMRKLGIKRSLSSIFTSYRSNTLLHQLRHHLSAVFL